MNPSQETSHQVRPHKRIIPWRFNVRTRHNLSITSIMMAPRPYSTGTPFILFHRPRTLCKRFCCLLICSLPIHLSVSYDIPFFLFRQYIFLTFLFFMTCAPKVIERIFHPSLPIAFKRHRYHRRFNALIHTSVDMSSLRFHHRNIPYS